MAAAATRPNPHPAYVKFSACVGVGTGRGNSRKNEVAGASSVTKHSSAENAEACRRNQRKNPRMNNEPQSGHEDEKVDEQDGEDAPLLEENHENQARNNEIHTLKMGRQGRRQQVRLRIAKMIKKSEDIAEDQSKHLQKATELEDEDDSPPSEGEDKKK